MFIDIGNKQHVNFDHVYKVELFGCSIYIYYTFSPKQEKIEFDSLVAASSSYKHLVDLLTKAKE